LDRTTTSNRQRLDKGCQKVVVYLGRVSANQHFGAGPVAIAQAVKQGKDFIGGDLSYIPFAEFPLDCFNCHFYLAQKDQDAMNIVEKLSKDYNIPIAIMLCQGCRTHNGQIPLQKHVFGESHRCADYECSQKKGLQICGDCNEFPCDNLRSLHRSSWRTLLKLKTICIKLLSS
jgi:hypothetical protein